MEKRLGRPQASWASHALTGTQSSLAMRLYEPLGKGYTGARRPPSVGGLQSQAESILKADKLVASPGWRRVGLPSRERLPREAKESTREPESPKRDPRWTPGGPRKCLRMSRQARLEEHAWARPQHASAYPTTECPTMVPACLTTAPAWLRMAPAWPRRPGMVPKIINPPTMSK